MLAVTFHHMELSSHAPLAKLITLHGWSGVDLFFVLSGFLIGGQFFGKLAKDSQIALWPFYFRRFTRTLPNYYFVLLACYVFWPGTPFGHATPLWRYLTFTQNIGPLEVFSPSWSLCVEEHFYLFFPLLALAVFGLAGPKKIARSILRWAIFITIAGIGIRTAIWFKIRPDLIAATSPNQAYAEYSTWIYNLTPMHLDGITWGVVLGALSVFDKNAWQKAVARPWLWAAIGCAFVSAAIATEHTTLLGSTGLMGLTASSLSFPFLALGFSSWIFPAMHFRRAPTAWLGKAFEMSAQLSYAIYLLNMVGIDLGQKYAATISLDPHGYPAALLCFGIVLALSLVLYHGLEKPVLRLRDRSQGARAG